MNYLTHISSYIRLFCTTLALFAIVALVSCVNELDVTDHTLVDENGLQEVALKIAPIESNVGVKKATQELAKMRFVVEVYDANSDIALQVTPLYRFLFENVSVSAGVPVNLSFKLKPEQTYTYLIWADYGAEYYDVTSSLKAVKQCSYTTVSSLRDAFSAVVLNRKLDQNVNSTVPAVLKHAVARFQISATDMFDLYTDSTPPPSGDHQNIKSVATKYASRASVFNVFDSSISGYISDIEIVQDDDFDYTVEPSVVFEDFIFAKNDTPSKTDIKFVLQTDTKSSDFDLTEVPLRRAYSTIASGELINGDFNTNLTIEIDDIWSSDNILSFVHNVIILPDLEIDETGAYVFRLDSYEQFRKLMANYSEKNISKMAPLEAGIIENYNYVGTNTLLFTIYENPKPYKRDIEAGISGLNGENAMRFRIYQPGAPPRVSAIGAAVPAQGGDVGYKIATNIELSTQVSDVKLLTNSNNFSVLSFEKQSEGEYALKLRVTPNTIEYENSPRSCQIQFTDERNEIDMSLYEISCMQDGMNHSVVITDSRALFNAYKGDERKVLFSFEAAGISKDKFTLVNKSSSWLNVSIENTAISDVYEVIGIANKLDNESGNIFLASVALNLTLNQTPVIIFTHTASSQDYLYFNISPATIIVPRIGSFDPNTGEMIQQELRFTYTTNRRLQPVPEYEFFKVNPISVGNTLITEDIASFFESGYPIIRDNEMILKLENNGAAMSSGIWRRAAIIHFRDLVIGTRFVSIKVMQQGNGTGGVWDSGNSDF